MDRVIRDTCRWAICPPLRGLFRPAVLAACVLGTSVSTGFAQRPFPGASPSQQPAVPSSTSWNMADEDPAPTASGSSQSPALAPVNRALAVEMPTRPTQQPGQQDRVQQVEFNVETILDEELVDIIIEGNHTIQANAILRQIQTQQGRAPSPYQIQQDVTRLLNTRWFLSVKPLYRQTKDGPVLVFQVIERPILRSVEFVGNKKIKTGELQAHTGLTPGHGYDVAANRESVARIKSLYLEKGYRFAKVTLEKGASKDERDVVFRIEEGPKVKVRSISFEGNSFSSSAVLRTKIATKVPIDNLSSYGPGWIGGDYDPEIVKNDVYALKQYYLSLGFFDVDVTVDERVSEADGKVAVRFTIDEGQRYQVGEIDVLGNGVLTRDQLLTDLELASGEFFNARFLRKDVSSMKDQYDERGHVFAKVEPIPQFRQNEPGVVDLLYQIDEDIPRYIGQINIHIRGEHTHTQERVVRNQVHRFLKPGTLASGSDLRMAQQRVQGSPIWERSDPPTFDIRPVDGLDYIPVIASRGQNPEEVLEKHAAELFAEELDRDFEIGTMYLPVSDHEVGRVTLPATVFEDDNPESEVEIRRELRSTGQSTVPMYETVKPEFVFRGQSPDVLPSTGVQLFRGQTPGNVRGQNLDAYGNPVPQDYLSGVSPQGDPFGDAFSNPAPGFVDVNIDVTEGRTGRLMFGVGVNSDAGVVGQLTLQEDNFDLLRFPRSWADVGNGQAFRGAGQSFRLEAVPGSQVSRYLVSWQDPFFLQTDFSLGLSGFYYNRFFDDWTEDRLGGRISLGYVLNRYWSASTALRLENVQVRDFNQAVAPADLVDVAGDNFLSTASFTLAYDTRDNSFNPSRGHNVDFTYEQGFGQFTYPRFDVSGGQYFTVYERPDGFGKHILKFTGQVGWTGDDTPIFERYFAGGYSSFRGFQFRGVTPREGAFAVGGEFLFLGTAEYGLPITASDSIRAVVFSDFGTVEPDAGFEDFRVTAGFGFRMIVPAMGPAPLAFDFAWPIVKQDFDELRVFSFYVGATR